MKIKVANSPEPIIVPKVEFDTRYKRKRRKIFNKRFIFKIEDEVREEFLDYCQKRGESAGRLLREHIKRILRDERAKEQKGV